MAPNHTYRVERGRILKILYNAFPDGVNKDVLSLTMQEMSFHLTEGVLRGHCDYLAGKGYIEVDGDKGNFITDYNVKITPKGIDLLEENIPVDPGVKF